MGLEMNQVFLLVAGIVIGGAIIAAWFAYRKGNKDEVWAILYEAANQLIELHGASGDIQAMADELARNAVEKVQSSTTIPQVHKDFWTEERIRPLALQVLQWLTKKGGAGA